AAGRRPPPALVCRFPIRDKNNRETSSPSSRSMSSRRFNEGQRESDAGRRCGLGEPAETFFKGGKEGAEIFPRLFRSGKGDLADQATLGGEIALLEPAIRGRPFEAGRFPAGQDAPSLLIARRVEGC